MWIVSCASSLQAQTASRSVKRGRDGSLEGVGVYLKSKDWSGNGGDGWESSLTVHILRAKNEPLKNRFICYQ